MPASPPSAMISKWSSKSPNQKATRIRNNQRRHRAKVKAHVSILETELAESQRRLVAAEHRITELTAEVNRLLDEARRGHGLTSASSVEHSFISPTPHTVLESPFCRLSKNQRELNNSTSSKQNAVVDLPFDGSIIPNSTLKDNKNTLSEINIGNSIEMDDPTIAAAFGEQYDCQTLPPQQPGESTTNCIAAYGIIGQQNFKGVSMEAIHQWIQSGYRRAKRPGDGCTVLNSHLYSIISHLSPV